MERCTGQGMGKGPELPCPLWVQQPPRNFTCSPTWRLSKPHCLGIFMEVPLQRHDWSNHWPLVMNSTSLEVSGWGWKFQPSTGLIGYSGNEPPFSKTHLNINPGMEGRGLLQITKRLFSLLSLRKFQGFLGSSVPGTRDEDLIYIFHIISQCHSPLPRILTHHVFSTSVVLQDFKPAFNSFPALTSIFGGRVRTILSTSL